MSIQVERFEAERTFHDQQATCEPAAIITCRRLSKFPNRTTWITKPGFARPSLAWAISRQGRP